MKNVYGYIRVSTAKQGEGVSLIAQQEAITRYAAQYQLNILEWFEEKETAAKAGRPLFTTMIKLLRAKKADGVIMHKIDRSARNLKDWADLGNLIDQGIEVHFAHESLDMQARGGRLSADIQAVIAADYIRNLRQEAIKGLYGRLKQGIYPFQAPTGYLDTGKGKVKAIDPVQGPLVKKAFELYASEKYSLKSLVAKMKELGLTNIKKRHMSINGMSVMLSNPYYIGIIRVKGEHYNGLHEPLVPPALFNKVQAVLTGKTNQKVKKPEFLFRKLIKCKHCGYSLIPERQKGHAYYRCHTKDCPTKSLRETRIQNHLLQCLAAAELQAEESSYLKKLFQETEKEWQEEQEKLNRIARMQMAQVQNRIDRLTDCYIEGGLDKDTYEERKQKLLMELKVKEAEQEDYLNGGKALLRKLAENLEPAKSLVVSYEKAVGKEKRDLVELVTSNLLAEGKKLMISMRSPFLELAERHSFRFGAPIQDTPRERHTQIDTTGTIASPSYPPLTKKQLRSLFELLVRTFAQLPEQNTPDNYAP